MSPSPHPGEPAMSRTRLARLVALLLALTLVTAACSQRDDGDDNTSSGNTSGNTDDTTGDGEDASSIDTANCPTDPSTPIEGDTIELVSSFPQSGLTAAFAQIANGWKA